MADSSRFGGVFVGDDPRSPLGHQISELLLMAARTDISMCPHGAFFIAAALHLMHRGLGL